MVRELVRRVGRGSAGIWVLPVYAADSGKELPHVNNTQLRLVVRKVS